MAKKVEMTSKKPDLSKLSREKKLELIDAIQEKKRRLKAEKPLYKPNTMQEAIHRCDKRLLFILSGNGAGKTTSLAQEAKWACDGFHPFLNRYFKIPSNIYVVLDAPSKVEERWLPELCKWFNITEDQEHKNGKPYVNSITFPNGSELIFLFHEQPDMVFESIEAEVFLFDEPPPRRIFMALTRGARQKNTKPRFIVAGTPLGQSWIRREYLEPWAKGEQPDVECFRFDSDVNKDHLNWSEQEKYFAGLTEKERMTRRHGHFFDLEGLALAGIFDRGVHVVKREGFKWDSSWPCVLSIDPHPSKSHHAVLLGANPFDELFVLFETAQKMVPREFARHLAERLGTSYRIIDIVVDSLGSGEGTGGDGFRSFIEVCNDEWRALGWPYRCRATTYSDKSDEDFVTRIQSALTIPLVEDNLGRRLPKLRILEGNRGIISDIENAEWQRDKAHDMNKPKLEISNRDYLSCLKYALATGLFYKRIERTHIQRDLPATYGAKGAKVSSNRGKDRPLSFKEWLKD